MLLKICGLSITASEKKEKSRKPNSLVKRFCYYDNLNFFCIKHDLNNLELQNLQMRNELQLKSYLVFACLFILQFYLFMLVCLHMLLRLEKHVCQSISARKQHLRPKGNYLSNTHTTMGFFFYYIPGIRHHLLQDPRKSQKHFT